MSSIPNQFSCFRINQKDEKIVSGLEMVSIEDINPGEVTLKTEYSSINYKDALAATGAGKILRKFPLIGGVDVAGEVVESEDPRFSIGDKVIAACSGLSETNDGGYSEYTRISIIIIAIIRLKFNNLNDEHHQNHVLVSDLNQRRNPLVFERVKNRTLRARFTPPDARISETRLRIRVRIILQREFRRGRIVPTGPGNRGGSRDGISGVVRRCDSERFVFKSIARVDVENRRGGFFVQRRVETGIHADETKHVRSD